jgi:predicted nucleotidyltransferase
MTPHEFAHQLEKDCDGNVESVILYGSAVGGDFSKEYSDYNLIVILKDPSPTRLAQTGPLVRKWVKKGNPAPHFFDPQHIEKSRDVFPLEFIDIADRHEVLFGTDPFKDMKINRANLRHQCESELKGKLLYLRAFYSLNCHKPKRVAQMMLRSLPGFIAVFRGVAHLIGQTPEKEARQLIEQLSKQIDFNPTPFMDLLAVREGITFLPRREEAISAFEKYLTEIATITNYVDKMT